MSPRRPATITSLRGGLRSRPALARPARAHGERGRPRPRTGPEDGAVTGIAAETAASIDRPPIPNVSRFIENHGPTLHLVATPIPVESRLPDSGACARQPVWSFARRKRDRLVFSRTAPEYGSVTTTDDGTVRSESTWNPNSSDVRRLLIYSVERGGEIFFTLRGRHCFTAWGRFEGLFGGFHPTGPAHSLAALKDVVNQSDKMKKGVAGVGGRQL